MSGSGDNSLTESSLPGNRLDNVIADLPGTSRLLPLPPQTDPSHLLPTTTSSDLRSKLSEETAYRYGGSPSVQDHPEIHQDRQLNVADALTYLDNVKVQFQDRPDVYNRFLDIMKDFKSQLIDTPGVIDRVSTLFRGHPTLIQGFNTFLPAGYRIECIADSANSDLITVTTPLGTTTQAIRSSYPAEREFAGRGYDVHPPQNTEVDIELALSYVQKVKTRYANDPDRYKAFLEILSPPGEDIGSAVIHDEEVVFRVAKLFKDDADLMKGFYHFLPDRNVQQRMAAKLDELEDMPRGEDRYSRRKPDLSGGASSSRGGVSSSIPQKRKRKAADREKEKEREREVVQKAGQSKRTKHAGVEPTPSPSLAQRHAVPPSPRRAAHGLVSSRSHGHAQQAAVPRYDETQFFDRVKRALDNRETYNEFLKLVNLFVQDIIDTGRLVREARVFLGESELMAQLKEILGWDERRERYAGAEDVWTRPTGVLDRPSRNQLNIRYGSYRRLPASEVNVVCSGRDEMCKSVLNDEWASQPTFASEDSGFLAHKKNAYEEALHRSEEERHEYDFHIEAIHRTIQMLEPFNNKINQMTNEEKANYKIKPNLAGAAKSIHLRVIKKVYGREAGVEVFQAIQDVPVVAIPLVLARLKQKHEEWKRAQREWNKVWKEVDARNYYKSLDHQAITFKAADKKAIAPKTFVNQVEAARDEQMAKRASLIDPLFSRTRPRHQLEYVLDDFEVLQDGMKLLFSYLDRTQGQLSLTDRKKIESFLRSFIPLFFMLDGGAFNCVFSPRFDAGDSDHSELDSMADDVDVSSSNSSRGGRHNNRKSGMSSGDLRKKLLKSEQAKSSRRTRAHEIPSPSSSRLASPAVPDAMQVDGEEGQLAHVVTNVNPVSGPSSPLDHRLSRKGTFFTNTHFYVVFRLIEVLWSRLQQFKILSLKLENKPALPALNSSALQLGALSDLAKLGESGNSNTAHFYELMLEFCERLFDNELEPHTFEDRLRCMFGLGDAYKMFTIDKLLGSIIKQVQTLLADPKCQDLYDVLRRERDIASPTTQDLINCRKNAERIVGPDENLFRMDWLPELKTATIQLLGKDDSSFDDSEVSTGRWQAYIDSYVSPTETEDLSTAAMRRPFLQRTRRLVGEENASEARGNGSLEIRVCVRTYKLFYVAGTEEYIFRTPSAEECERAKQNSQAHNARRMMRLDKLTAREPVAGTTPAAKSPAANANA